MCNTREDTNPEQGIFLGFLINAAVGVPFAFFNATADPVAWGSIAFLGLIQVGVAYIFFSVGIKRTPALLACLITAFEPMLNPLWVALGTGETPGPLALVGGFVIVAAVVGYNVLEESRKRGERVRRVRSGNGGRG
jgi:drug/metabolite transporter (DMT)-like permease